MAILMIFFQNSSARKFSNRYILPIIETRLPTVQQVVVPQRWETTKYADDKVVGNKKRQYLKDLQIDDKCYLDRQFVVVILERDFDSEHSIKRYLF